MDKDDVTHTHTHEYYSAIKNEILPLAKTWIGLEANYAEWNKFDRERQILYYFTYINIWNLKCKTKE